MNEKIKSFKKLGAKFFSKNTFISILIIFSTLVIFPVGIILVWIFKRHWFKKVWFILLALFSLFIFVVSIVGGIEGERERKEQIAKEEKRNYSITYNHDIDTIDGKRVAVIPCNLSLKKKSSDSVEKYEGEFDILHCNIEGIKGEFTHYSTVELHSKNDDQKILKNQNQFRIPINTKTYNKEIWEKDTINLSEEDKNIANMDVKLALFNRVLEKEVKTSEVRFVVKLSDDDVEKIKTHNKSYLDYKSEQELIAKREAEAKAAAEARSKQQALNRQSLNSNKNINNKPTTTPTPQPQQSNNLPFKAICKDGTISYQDNPAGKDYRGMCSGHGGIQAKLGRVP